ncbi:MAG TPA: serine/threonine-protein kinase [Vicinamibacterales bacterium]|nr:serine/threonine-protein kinase [Vicinamibacterales bacterium]
MSQTRWRQINDLFHEALARDPAGRDAFIDERAAGDDELAREVRSLLASHHRSGGFLEAPAWEVASGLLADGEGAGLVGRQIGSYRIVEEIGRGGMGVVYAAEDLRLRRMVALKALPIEYTRDPRRRERLQREAQAAAQLSHETIATVHALEEIDGVLFIVSELVRGRTLREELQDGPIPSNRLLETLIDVASALAVAHAHGIVHRDLKPENLLRRDDGRVKVLDFGLARFTPAGDAPTMTKATEQGMIAGTPGYLAPEQVAGGEADPRSDVFVFGLLAWELATGLHPFGSNRSSQIARLVELSEGRLVTLRGVLSLAGLDPIIRRCLHREPGLRYPSGEALLQDLRCLRENSRGDWMSADGLWWWQFHQWGVAVLLAVMPILAWMIRRWVGPLGPAMFFTILALATTAVTLRLNLVFTSRVQAGRLTSHHARLFPWIARLELGLAALLVVSALFIAASHEATAAALIAIAVVTAASILVIEPATAGAAGIRQG